MSGQSPHERALEADRLALRDEATRKAEALAAAVNPLPATNAMLQAAQRDDQALIQKLRGEIVELQVMVVGSESGLRLEQLEHASECVRRWRAENESVSVHLERAMLQEVLAERASRTGVPQMPLNAEAARRFFDAMDGDTNHEQE